MNKIYKIAYDNSKKYEYIVEIGGRLCMTDKN